jgi:hypothetical protein
MDDVHGLTKATLVGIEGKLNSLCSGLLFNKCEVDNMPLDLPWCYCEIYSRTENVLIEDTMPREKQMKEGQGTFAFQAVNGATMGNRADSLKYPLLKNPPTVSSVGQSIQAHRDKLEQARLDAERNARGEAAEVRDDGGDDEASSNRPAFRPAGIATLGSGGDAGKKKGAPKVGPGQGGGRGSGRSAGRGVQAGAAKVVAAVAASPQGKSAPGTPAVAAAAASSRLTFQDNTLEEWKKVDPQALLDGTDSLGKKLNGVSLDFKLAFPTDVLGTPLAFQQ